MGEGLIRRVPHDGFCKVKGNDVKILRRPGTGTHQSGFTLLEMMVAMSILAIVLVSLFRMQSSSLQLAASRKFHATASLLARMKIAETEIILKNKHFENGALPLSGDFGEAYPGYLWHRKIDHMPESVFDNTESPVGKIGKERVENFKRIDIEILFRDQYHFNVTAWRLAPSGS